MRTAIIYMCRGSWRAVDLARGCTVARCSTKAQAVKEARRQGYAPRIQRGTAVHKSG